MRSTPPPQDEFWSEYSPATMPVECLEAIERRLLFQPTVPLTKVALDQPLFDLISIGADRFLGSAALQESHKRKGGEIIFRAIDKYGVLVDR